VLAKDLEKLAFKIAMAAFFVLFGLSAVFLAVGSRHAAESLADASFWVGLAGAFLRLALDLGGRTAARDIPGAGGPRAWPGDLLVIVLLGLIPLLWFKQGTLIGGVDFDMPLFPVEQFHLRKYTWNPVFLGGMDYSPRISGLFTFTAFQAGARALGLDLSIVQRLYFVFWYTLSGLSMYFMMCNLVRGRDAVSGVARMGAVILYMVNFYQLHIWMIARKGELCGYIIVPASIGLIAAASEKRIRFRTLFFAATLVYFIGSGIGTNPPIIGIFFMAVVACVCFVAIAQALREGRVIRPAGRALAIGGLLIGAFFLVNFHWILPFVNFIVQAQFLDIEKTRDVFALKELLETTSRHNSLLNVMRMYGDSNFFDGFKGVCYMPFFPSYEKSAALVLGSFLFPFLAYGGLRATSHPFAGFFGFLLVVSTFMGKGIHAPFGDLFLWVYQHVPGFWVYRAPWQKFGILMTVAYAFLAGLCCSSAYAFFSRRKKAGTALRPGQYQALGLVPVITILAAVLTYNHAFLRGRMIPTTEERKTLPGFHQRYPKYLFDSARWINAMKDEFNMVLMPDDRANAYTWGYGGAYDITLKLFSKGLLFRQYGEGMAAPHGLDKVYDAFVKTLYGSYSRYAGRILGALNVRYVLQRNDFMYDWSGDSDSPRFLRERLSEQEGLKLERTFGQWDFYSNAFERPRVYGAYEVISCNADPDVLHAVMAADDFPDGVPMVFEEEPPFYPGLIPKSARRKALVKTNKIHVTVKDGMIAPYAWGDSSPVEARRYEGSKVVVRSDGVRDEDALVFASPEEVPYEFPGTGRDHGAYNSTLVFIKTGNRPLSIEGILADGKKVNDLVGVWWSEGWMGMGTKPVQYPIVIPEKERAIIQINHLVREGLTLILTPRRVRSLFRESQSKWPSAGFPEVSYTKINPTKYLVKVRAYRSFLLVFCTRFHPQWHAYVSSEGEDNSRIMPRSALLDALVNGERRKEITRHLQVDGYANGWWVDLPHEGGDGKSKEVEIVLEYWPQRLFEVGFAVSAVVLLCSILGLFLSFQGTLGRGSKL